MGGECSDVGGVINCGIVVEPGSTSTSSTEATGLSMTGLLTARTRDPAATAGH